MSRILAVSSQVVSGHVGLSAIVPTLQRLGHDVLAMPTVLLSNHPGAQPASGTRIDPDVLRRILETLEANGRLDGVDAVLTGYLPSPAHVAVAVEAVTRCRALDPGTLVLCDPVIGDDPKGVYIDAAAAAALRADLAPLADILTPNRFELAWLSGNAVSDPASAIAAAARLPNKLVVAKSIAMPADRLATLAISTTERHETSVAVRPAVPNGTGDLLAALFLSEYLATGRKMIQSLTAAVAAVDRVLDRSQGRSELDLSGDWHRGMTSPGRSS